MTLRMVTWAERPELSEMGPASADVWPEYNLHGDVLERWWPSLEDELPEYQFALVDDDAQLVVAEAHTAPLAWNGDDRELPDGIDDALQRAVEARRRRAPVDTLCAFAAEVAPAARRRAGSPSACLGR